MGYLNLYKSSKKVQSWNSTREILGENKKKKIKEKQLKLVLLLYVIYRSSIHIFIDLKGK